MFGILVLALSSVIFTWVVYDTTLGLVLKSPHKDENPLSVGDGSKASGQQEVKYNIQDIANAHLFGVAKVQPRPATEMAPETKLRLSLGGLIASDNPRFARALIQINSGRMRSYRIGDQIAGTDAKLQRVTDYKVLLNRNGHLESLAMKRKELL